MTLVTLYEIVATLNMDQKFVLEKLIMFFINHVFVQMSCIHVFHSIPTDAVVLSKEKQSALAGIELVSSLIALCED